MRTRLGIVLWWLGTLLGCVSGLACVSASLYESNVLQAVVGGPVLAAISAAPFWAAAFVVAGSFWRPPRQSE